jgi:hypothetical protein
LLFWCLSEQEEQPSLSDLPNMRMNSEIHAISKEETEEADEDDAPVSAASAAVAETPKPDVGINFVRGFDIREYF